MKDDMHAHDHGYTLLVRLSTGDDAACRWVPYHWTANMDPVGAF
jgi:hypothetical protein